MIMDTPRTDKLTGLRYNACKLIALSKELEIESKKNHQIAVHYALEYNKVQREMIALRAQRDALARWKAEALAVESEWDPQEVGKLLELPLGASIRPRIAPCIHIFKTALERIVKDGNRPMSMRVASPESIAKKALEGTFEP